MSDTIFALATPPGRSGVAVIRVSGPSAHDCAVALGAYDVPVRAVRTRQLVDTSGGTLDYALVLRFDAPASFTGEDVIEFQAHGGKAVVQGILRALAAIPGTRLAEPGEFTRRALVNGKLDLAQVEGLGDLLAAETQMQAKQAFALMDGQLTRMVQTWRDGLIEALATLEASIDFSDDGVSEDVLTGTVSTLSGLIASFDREIATSDVAERLRVGFEVALVGAPNVGKSTLLNALAKRDVAITSEYAGTTRDILEVKLDLGGLPVTILDTAGIRESADPVESIGVARSIARANQADLRIFLLDVIASGPDGIPVCPGDIVVLSKADMRRSNDAPAVSGVTGVGLAHLLGRISDVLGDRVASAGAVGHARQRERLRSASDCLRQATKHLEAMPTRVEFAAMEVGAAVTEIDSLIGRIDTEQVLDVIFANFCLGK